MCGLCGVLGVEHWTDRTGADQAGGAGGGPTARRQARLRRASLLNDILSLYRIRVDDWQGTSMAVRGPTGRTELAESLIDLWPKAEAVSNRRLDPLDPELLRHLESLGKGPGA